MNISFGVQSDNPKLKEAIDEALDKEIIIVAASGNTLGLSVDYPAKYENVISVSAIKENLKTIWCICKRENRLCSSRNKYLNY